MRYAISYVSTAQKDLQEEGVKNIMNEADGFNNRENISGILLYNERNFFQLIEGEKEIIQDLYEKIKLDRRHLDIIKFLETPVSIPPFDGYLAEFITDNKKCEEEKLKKYLHYIEVLNPKSQKAIKRVMELMMV